MTLIVKKFGGSSIGTIERIELLAQILAEDKKSGDDIVVVVSAMAKTTDYLFSLAFEISETPFQRELDMLVTAGERISMSLLSIALHKYGVSAISFTGSQSGIITDNNHGNANIVNVSGFRIREELNKGKIVIVAGFQGVSNVKEVTTLGRGGSDTTAVALAGYLNADKCQIFKDVEGLYDADPNIVKEANKIEAIDYDTMLFISQNGGKVIHPRAVEFAMKYNIEVEIKSSFNNNSGSFIAKKERIMEKGDDMEEKEIKSITGRKGLVCFDIRLENESLMGFLETLDSRFIEILDYSIPAANQFRFVIREDAQLRVESILAELEIEPNAVHKGVNSVAITGYRLVANLSFLSELLKVFTELKLDVLSLSNNHLGVTVYFYDGDNELIIQNLHTKFLAV